MKFRLQILLLAFAFSNTIPSFAQKVAKTKSVENIRSVEKQKTGKNQQSDEKSKPDEKIILDLLERQTVAWNKGNIEEFMNGYWEHDSLMFIGKSGITYGYLNTMNRYKRNYSDTTIMGKLKFTILHVKKLSNDIYQVIGKFHLTRTIGDAEGHYTLIFKRMNGKWFIISDHSS